MCAITESLRIRTVAVDFDGVIHTYDRGWADGSIYGEFMPGAVSALTNLMSRYAVYVHTARNPRQVAAWIEDQSGHAFECLPISRWSRRKFWNKKGLLLVSNRKLPASVYIDDGAIRFESWDQTMVDLVTRLNHGG